MKVLAVIFALALSVPNSRLIEPNCVVPYQKTFVQVAEGRWVDRASQVWAESGFNRLARSPVGAMGLSQFMPGTWKEWMGNADPFDPVLSIQAQHRYMLWLEARTTTRDAALASYNAGLGSIRKAERLADSLGIEGSERWRTTLPRITGKHSEETLNYTTRIAKYRYEINTRLSRQK